MRQIAMTGEERMQEDEMLKADEVAKIMKVNIRTVRLWVATGEITIIWIGKREYRIARSELNRFIKERQGRKGTD
jgi:excisionase family DNA binding protein